MITRIPVVDDTGDGTSGTPITAAWWAQVQDMIDGRWTKLGITPSGTVNDVPFGEADLIVIAGTTGPVTITGLAAPANPRKDGKTVRIFHVGDFPVYLVHQSPASSVGSRLYNVAHSGPTPIVNGYAVYSYTGQDWVLVSHEQGAWVDLALTADMFSSQPSGAFVPVLGGSSATRYRLSGRTLSVLVRLVPCTITVAGSQLLQTVPLTYTGHVPYYVGAPRVNNAGAFSAGTMTPNGRSMVYLADQLGNGFAASSNATSIEGMFHFEID